MKQLLLAGTLAVGAVGAVGVGRAQQQQQPTTLPLDSTTHKISYSAVVQVPGASQAELYGRALRWLAAVVPGTAGGVRRG